MNNKQKIALASWAVDHARKCGANDAAVSVSRSRQIEIEVRKKQTDKLKESVQNSLGLVLYVKRRYSGHSTNNLKKEDLKTFIEEAVSMTKYLNEDPYRSLPDPKHYEGQKKVDLQVFDASYPSIDAKARLDTAQKIEEAASSQSENIISVTSWYSDSHNEYVRVHSNGFVGERESTVFAAGAEATVKDPAGGRPEDWFYASVRFFKDLPDAGFIGKEAAGKALKKIGQKKIDSGTYDMIVENRSVGRLLGSLLYPMSARAIQQKSSFLEGKLNKQVASEKLTLIDDPFVPKGLGSRHFDSEGMAAKRVVIVEKGVLKQFYVDDYYGKKLGWEPTTASPSNVVFEAGTKSLEDLVTATKKGILVTGFIGGNSNSATGDYSFGIVGRYIEEGKIVQSVNEMNITGNLESLLQQLAEIGNDPYPYSSLRSPSLLFKDISFSGI